MIRLAIIATLGLSLGCLFLYGAMRVAESIARNQQQQIETIESNQ